MIDAYDAALSLQYGNGPLILALAALLGAVFIPLSLPSLIGAFVDETRRLFWAKHGEGVALRGVLVLLAFICHLAVLGAQDYHTTPANAHAWERTSQFIVAGVDEAARTRRVNLLAHALRDDPQFSGLDTVTGPVLNAAVEQAQRALHDEEPVITREMKALLCPEVQPVETCAPPNEQATAGPLARALLAALN